jgi:hypothetical protein
LGVLRPQQPPHVREEQSLLHRVRVQLGV